MKCAVETCDRDTYTMFKNTPICREHRPLAVVLRKTIKKKLVVNKQTGQYDVLDDGDYKLMQENIDMICASFPEEIKKGFGSIEEFKKSMKFLANYDDLEKKMQDGFVSMCKQLDELAEKKKEN